MNLVKMGDIEDMTENQRESRDHKETLMARLQNASKLQGDRDKDDLGRLLDIWNGREDNDAEWADSPDPYCYLSRQLLLKGLPQIAKEVALTGLEFTKSIQSDVDVKPWRENVELRLLLGLSLARTANVGKAQEVLWGLHKETVPQGINESNRRAAEEIIGTLARTYKDQALLIDEPKSHRALIQQSCELYDQAYRLTRGYWTGINVVTLSRLIGRNERAVEVALEVQAQCEAELERMNAGDNDRFWVLATLGEIALNRHDLGNAGKYYREAWQNGREWYGHLCAARRQARWLLRHWDEDEAVLDEWIPMPLVAICVGHMIDKADRDRPRFPSHLADPVGKAITAWLKRKNALIGFSSAACGTDILFQEAMRSQGGECHVVLPFQEGEFVQQSVAVGGSGDWTKRFAQVVQRATKIVYSSPSKLRAEGAAFLYSSDILHGLAKQRAMELDTKLEALVVWDGQRGDGPGGTSDFVAQCHLRNLPVDRVDISCIPQDLSEAVPVVRDKTSEPLKLAASTFTAPSDYCVMAMLFADAVGFSKLHDSDTPVFVKEFLGRVAQIVHRYESGGAFALVYQQHTITPENLRSAFPSLMQKRVIPVRGTWGDGLYFAFWSLSVAGNFALDLLDLVNDTKWISLGLSQPVNLRIALHAGPVHPTIDPVTSLPGTAGAHVSRAARLEPVTPPGEVYASEAFAALSILHGVIGFKCDYIKQLGWAKRYGSFPTYLVTRS